MPNPRIPPRRRGLVAVTAAAALAACGIAVFHAPLLARYGAWLVVRDPVDRAEAAVVLGGYSGFRVEKGVELVDRGIVARLAVTAEPAEFPELEEPSVVRWLALADTFGVPRDSIDVLMPSHSTFDDAWLARRWAESHGYRSLVFVTDPYHTRRARWVVTRIFADSGIEVSMIACDAPWVRPEAWWKDERQLLSVVLEYLKLGYYAASYGVSGPIDEAPGAFHTRPASDFDSGRGETEGAP